MFLFASFALAQHVDIDQLDVLTIDDLPYAASALGHPSLGHDGDHFVALFEAEVEVEGCDQAYVIGRATSSDGISWDVDPATLGATPSAPCGRRAPAAAATDDGLFVLSERVHDGAWVLHRRSGRRLSVTPTTGLEGLRDVSIARRDGTWSAVGIHDADGLVIAHSDDGVDWVVEPGAGLTYGTTWWSATSMRSPSLSCFDGEGLPWVMHYGGTTGDDAGFTYGQSSDLGTWFLSLAAQIWTPQDAWQAWDAVASPSHAWILYADDGALSWAATDPAEVPAGHATRDCHTAP